MFGNTLRKEEGGKGRIRRGGREENPSLNLTVWGQYYKYFGGFLKLRV